MAIDDPGITSAVWQPETRSPAAGGSSLDVRFEAPPERQRLWAIPIFGFVAKAVILVPHAICLIALLWFVGLGLPGAASLFLIRLVQTLFVGNFLNPDLAGFAFADAITSFVLLGLQWGAVQLVLWIWVLFGGRYPTWGYALVGGTLRWLTRVTAFSFGLTDCYPPFSFKGVPARRVDTFVAFTLQDRSIRWWAVPVFGLWAKLIVLVPHFIVLAVIGALAGVIGHLLVPFWVLFSGRYPSWAMPIVGGSIRYSARVYAFLFGLTDRYPRFALN